MKYMLLLFLKMCRTCVPANDTEISLPEENDWGWNINDFVIHNLFTSLFVFISWDCCIQSNIYYKVWNSSITPSTIKHLKIFVNSIIRNCEWIVNGIEQNEKGGLYDPCTVWLVLTYRTMTNTDISHCGQYRHITLWLALKYWLVLTYSVFSSKMQLCNPEFWIKLVYLFSSYSSYLDVSNRPPYANVCYTIWMSIKEMGLSVCLRWKCVTKRGDQWKSQTQSFMKIRTWFHHSLVQSL